MSVSSSRAFGVSSEQLLSGRAISPHCQTARVETSCHRCRAQYPGHYLLRDQTTYQEKGETFFEEQDRQGAEKRLVCQLSRLGYDVTLQPIAQASSSINWGIKVLLRLGVRLTILGPMMLLTVRGRKTGRPRTTPVDLHEHNGRRFLIATYGEGHWVQNLRAAGGGILSLGRSRQVFTAVELSPEAAGLIIRNVLSSLLASRGVRGSALRQHLGVRADSSLEDFVAVARSHPVFELGFPGRPNS